MNTISGIPVLFGWIMYTGGPSSAFANWTMVGGLSFIVSLSMAEIAAAMPTSGGIYFWRQAHKPALIYDADRLTTTAAIDSAARRGDLSSAG